MFRDQIKKGAAVLDEYYEGWLDRINLDLLDMRDGHFCILGQADPTRDYVQTRNILFPKETTYIDAFDHGFNTLFDWEHIEILTQEWKDYIRARREEKQTHVN